MFQNSEKNGFTLFELVVVMAIISIMSVVVISGYSSQQDSRALSLGKSQVINDIRIVQSRSYNGISVDGADFPEGGYGIRFTKDSSSYIVFTDLDRDRIYDEGEEIETIELPRNVEVSCLKKDGSVCGVFTDVDIVFQPFYGKVFIDEFEESEGEFIDLEIEIENQGGSTKIIEVSSSRLIK